MDILSVLRADLAGKSIADMHAVAEAMGVPYSTLRKIVDENTTDPRYLTVEKIRAYYARPKRRSSVEHG